MIKPFSCLQLMCPTLLLLVCLFGCGGSTPPAGSGRLPGAVTVTIRWPSTREIPPETRSIRLSAKVLEPSDGPVVGQAVIPRPVNASTSQATLQNLPSVEVLLTAAAFSSTDGSGTPLAEGTTQVVVPESNTVPASITLQASTPPVLPSVSAYASASNDQGKDSVIDAGSRFTASASMSGTKQLLDTNVIVPTAASSSVDHAKLSGSVTSVGRHASSMADTLTFNAPGRAGQSGEAVVVMHAEGAQVDGAIATSYSYKLRTNLDTTSIQGVTNNGALLQGVAPPSGEQKLTIHFVYGQPIGFVIELDYTFVLLQGPALGPQSAHWNFVRFENLPAGTTITAASQDGWPVGG